MSVKLLTEHHLEFLSSKGGCTGSFKSTLVKMTHCWKSHVMAQIKEDRVKMLKVRNKLTLLIAVKCKQYTDIYDIE